MLREHQCPCCLLNFAAPLPLSGGGFTNVDPESRRVVPEANGRTKLKVRAATQQRH